MLPVKVSEPMMIEPAMVADAMAFVPSPRLLTCSSSAPATMAEAAPPKPLKMATICGMAVSWTSRADAKPMAVPRTMPMIIHSGLTMRWSSSVTTTAINMPSAESRLPARAVSGDRSHSRPTMNSTAATM